MCTAPLASSALICQQSQAHSTPFHAVGGFKLKTNHALTLIPKTHAVLRVANGRVWVTFANASRDLAVRAGDHFLHPGQTLSLGAGQTVVMEAMSPDVYFDLTLDAKSLASFSQVTVKSKAAVVSAPLTRNSFFDQLYAWFSWFRKAGGCRSQSAHAFGQTHPHPFAAATQGCQS